MPIYTGKIDPVDYSRPQDTSSGVGIVPTAKLQAMQNWTPLLADFITDKIAEPGKTVSKQDAENKAKVYGVHGLNIPESGIGEYQLDSMIKRREKMMVLERDISRSSSGAAAKTSRFATQIGTGLVDPLNVAISYVPIVGQARYARWLAGTSSLAGRIGVRAAAGALEGGVGNAIFEPLYYGMRRSLGDDYTMTDSLMNIAMGGVFGAVSHNVFGGIGDFYRWGRGLPQPWQNVGVTVDGVPVNRAHMPEFADRAMYGDFPRPVDAEASISDAVALAMGREAQTPAPRPDFTISKTDIDAIPDIAGLRLRTVEDFDAPEVRNMIDAWVKAMPDTATPAREVSPGVTEIRFGRGILDDAGNMLPSGATRLRNAILGKAFGDRASILADPAPMPIRNAATAIARTAPDIMRLQSAIEAGKSPATISIADDLVEAVSMLREARERRIPLAEEVAGRGEINDNAALLASFMDKNGHSSRMMAEAIGNYHDIAQKAVDSGRIVPKEQLLSEALASVRENAADLFGRLGFQAKEDMLRVATAQMLDGRAVDVDVVARFHTGEASAADVARATAESMAPERVLAADMPAAREADDAMTRVIDTDDVQAAIQAADDAVRATDDAAKSGQFLYARSDVAMLSRSGSIEPTGMTRESVEAEARLAFPKDFDALTAKNSIEVVQHVSDLPAGVHPIDTQGAYQTSTGKSWIVADNIPAGSVRDVILHEVGVHHGMEDFLTASVWNRLKADVAARIDAGDAVFTAARRMVQDGTPDADVIEETIAYMVMSAPEHSFTQKIVSFIRRQLWKFGLANLTDGDIRQIAYASLKNAGKKPIRVLDLGGMRYANQKNGFILNRYGNADFGSIPRSVSELTGGKVEALPIRMEIGRENDFGFVHGMREERILLLRQAGFSSVENYVEYVSQNFTHVAISKNNDRVLLYVSPSKRGRAVAGKKAGKAVDNLLVLELKKTGDFYTVMTVIPDKSPNHKFSGSNKLVWERSPVAASADPQKPISNLSVDGGSSRQAIGDGQTSLNDVITQPDADFKYSVARRTNVDVTGDLAPMDEAVKMADTYASAVQAAAKRWGMGDDAMKAAMQDASGGKLRPAEIDDLLNALKEEKAAVRKNIRKVKQVAGAGDVVDALEPEAMQAADTVANNVKIAASIEKRNAAIDLKARMAIIDRVSTFRQRVGDDASVEGFLSMIGGSQYDVPGARISAEAEVRSLSRKYLGGLRADLEKAHLYEMFADNVMQRETVAAMSMLNTPGMEDGLRRLPGEAVEMAKILNKWIGYSREQQNRFGAWIGKREGYVVPQTHDMFKIRKAGFAKWSADILPKLDLEQMGVDPANADAMLKNLYRDFASGLHEGPSTDNIHVRALPGSTAKRVSRSRKIFFKTADDWLAYNQAYGKGPLSLAAMDTLERGAKNAAIMKRLGTNPESNITRALDIWEDGIADPAKRAKFHENRKNVINLLHRVDGTSNIPAHAMGARVSANLRAWESMSRMGSALLSQLSDIPIYASAVKYDQGRNMLSGMREAIVGLLSGRPRGEQALILSEIGMFGRDMMADIHSRLSVDELRGGRMSSMMQKFFQLNGMGWWTDSMQANAALSISRYLGSITDTAFDGLDAGAKRFLSEYGIDAGLWGVIGKLDMTEADGARYLTPETVRKLPDDAVAEWLGRNGRRNDARAVANAKTDIEDGLRSMFIDRVMSYVVEPDARAREFFLRGTRPGTVPGELLRFFAQFKSFPTAYIQKVLGREIYGRGYNGALDLMMHGKGDALGVAQLMLWSTVFGYMSMVAKDVTKGRTPRSPLADESRDGEDKVFFFNIPEIDDRTVMAAFLQGGGLGIYGDFLFGDMMGNRFGNGMVNTMSGPVIGAADDVMDLWSRAKRGDDMAASALRFATQNTPFMNMYYIRPALDYLFLYNLQENMNPGYLRRMERRIEKENGQTFILKPSEYAK